MYNKKIDKNLRYDFLPSAIEIIEKPVSPLGSIIIYIITFFIISLIIWACVGKVDQVVKSSGQVVTVDGIQTINTNLNGKIISINKSEGEKIEKGEEILKIENEGLDGQIQRIQNKINEAKLQEAICDSIVNNNNVPDSVYSEYNVSEEKIQEYKLEEEIRLQEETSKYDEYMDQINSINEQIDDISKEASNKEGYSDVDKESDKSKISNLESRLNELKKSYEAQVNETKLQYVQKRNELQETLDSLQNEVDSLSINEDNYSIKSNVSGTIIAMNYNTVGSYVNQATSIAEVVQEDADLEIETTIQNKDISKVKLGQKVIIKLDAYNYQEYGTLTGKVSYIAPSSTVTKNSQVVYKVKISFDINQNNKITILPGMTLNVEIKTKKERIIDIFLKPFKGIVDEAF